MNCIRIGSHTINLDRVDQVYRHEDHLVDVFFSSSRWDFERDCGGGSPETLRLTGENARAFLAFLNEQSFDVLRWYQQKGEQDAKPS